MEAPEYLVLTAAPGGQEASTKRGFTLVESLVVIAVIAVLVSIALPALRSARSSSKEIACQSSLRSSVQALSGADPAGGDCWPTLFQPGQVHRTFTVGTTVYGLSPFGQCVLWIGTIVGGDRWEYADTAQFSCPEVARGAADGEGVSASRLSYWYSSAMFTDPALWEPGKAARRENPNQWVRPVARAQVRHPSAKVVLAESSARHGNLAPLWSGECDRVQAGFADGHVLMRSPDRATAALSIRADYSIYGLPDGITVPYSSAPGGANGRDE